MSLLLKALEKSEENQETTEAAGSQQEAGAGSSLGGMKLSGGGQSKLGSALAGAKKETSAKKVVAAYQEVDGGFAGGGEVDEAQEALIKASRASRIRTVIVLVVVAVVGFGGWQAYNQFFPATQQASEESGGGGGGVAAAVEEVAPDEAASFLPLAEPIYDIQENILTASTAPGASDSSSSQRDVVRDVRSYVERILEDQLRRSEAATSSSSGDEVSELNRSETEELSQLLSEDINWEEIDPVTSSAVMLTKLEALSQVPSQEDAKQFIRKTLGDTVASSNAPASEGEAESTQAEKPRAVAQITKKDNGLGKVMDKALAQYRSGDLSGSEISFRTILASEPKNTNALIGLARVHHARGNNRLSVATLLKAAEYSPNSPLVISELIAVQGSAGSPELTESKVLGLLGRTSDKAIQSKLLFVLGNMHAERQDWIMAKSMYFEAHQVNQGNPDIAYNLAVVYDYLGDSKKALEMYGIALNAALETPSSFSHQVAKDRINSLSN